jgi:hypothetical protein
VTFNGAVSPQMSLALDGFRNNGLLPFCEEHARETLAIYASLRRTAWEAAMEVLYVTCCGIDVHKVIDHNLTRQFIWNRHHGH